MTVTCQSRRGLRLFLAEEEPETLRSEVTSVDVKCIGKASWEQGASNSACVHTHPSLPFQVSWKSESYPALQCCVVALTVQIPAIWESASPDACCATHTVSS